MFKYLLYIVFLYFLFRIILGAWRFFKSLRYFSSLSSKNQSRRRKNKGFYKRKSKREQKPFDDSKAVDADYRETE